MKKITKISFFIGIFLMIASVVITFISVANANIIGGADFPAFLFYFGQISWLAWIGACLTVFSIVAFILRKK